MAKNEPTLKEGATHVAVGSTIGTNVGEMTFTDTNSSGLMHCSKATMTGTVTKNSGGRIRRHNRDQHLDWHRDEWRLYRFLWPDQGYSPAVLHQINLGNGDR